MPKKSKATKTKVAKKAVQEVQALVPDKSSEGAIAKLPKQRPPLRAIRVDDDLLKAAKDYKKASGKSFYSLGYEAIRDRLIKEGFLESTPQEKS